MGILFRNCHGQGLGIGGWNGGRVRTIRRFYRMAGAGADGSVFSHGIFPSSIFGSRETFEQREFSRECSVAELTERSVRAWALRPVCQHTMVDGHVPRTLLCTGTGSRGRAGERTRAHGWAGRYTIVMWDRSCQLLCMAGNGRMGHRPSIEGGFGNYIEKRK